MPKGAVFTMKLEPELRADFIAEAAGEGRPASQVLHELMRGYVESQAWEYDDYLRRKVKAGLVSMRAGCCHSNEKVEAEFTAKRRSAADHA